MRTLTLSILCLIALPARADLEWRGFTEYALGAQTREHGPVHLHEARLQIAGDHYGDRSETHFALDVIADRAMDEEEFELREAFARMDLFGRIAELRVGRQPMTWGTGDLIFLNDVFPKDYESFFLGRDDVYLKAPVDAARLTVFAKGNTLDIAWLPRMTADRLPDAGRFGIARLQLPDLEDRPNELSEGAVASRLARTVGSWNTALYAAHGRGGQPTGFRDDMLFHPRRTLFGASGRGALRGGVAWLEGGRELVDQEGGARQPVDSWSAFGGYERSFWSDGTVNAQVQWTEPDEGDASWLWTSRFEQLWMSQTLKLSLFGFYSPTDEDGLLRASLAYDVEDGLRVTLGGQLFHGLETGSFGRLGDADSAYLRVRRMF